ncbi:MAG TPA: hypothetical protein ENN69_06110, partial [Spirochaetia bacterium]|nr:hypothetical protein [Spirochaetia bacterium]
MKKQDVLQKIPKEGLLRLTQETVDLPEAKRIALIRRGNELFNQGRLDVAKKIFLTARYTDGLVRLGDRALEEQKPLEAFRLYWIARHTPKRDAL